MIPKSRKIAFMAVMAALTLAALACALTAPTTAAQVGAELATPTATAAQIATERPTAPPQANTCTVTAANLHLRAAASDWINQAVRVQEFRDFAERLEKLEGRVGNDKTHSTLNET